MSSLTGWKMAASFVFIAAIAVLFGYSGRGQERVLVNPPAIALPARTEILSRFPFPVSRALGRGPCEKGRLLLECAVP